MPDYKSAQESWLLSTLLSRSTPTLQCQLFNMKNNVHLMMTVNHRMSLQDVVLQPHLSIILSFSMFVFIFFHH